MPFSKLWRLREKWRREMFLRGSPSFRLGVWAAGIAGGLLWIWTVEKDMPIEKRRIFLPLRREIPMGEDEILRWNAKLTGKRAQDLLPVPKPVRSGGAREGIGERTGCDDSSAAELKGCRNPHEDAAALKQANCPLTVDELREKVKAEIEHEEAKNEAASTKKRESLFAQLNFRTYRVRMRCIHAILRVPPAQGGGRHSGKPASKKVRMRLAGSTTPSVAVSGYDWRRIRRDYETGAEEDQQKRRGSKKY